MPYIDIKAFPKEEWRQKELVDRINQALLDVWGCSQEAVSISLESIPKEEWDQKVNKPLVDCRPDEMMIFHGKKNY